MRVTIYIENSQGEELMVFDETVGKGRQREIIEIIMQQAMSIERSLAMYLATMKEDP